MNKTDMEKVGAFVAELRKEKGWTQKQLAETMGVTNKAVSKWERGVSLPDTALLLPLAETLGINVTELLSGERLTGGETFDIHDVEKLVTGSLELSKEEQERRSLRNRKRLLWYLLELAVVALELFLLRFLGFGIKEMSEDLAVVVSLPLLFGIWFFFFIKETLPSYYDKEKINYYSDGFFRMNVAGLSFNNHNWPHILKAGRIFCGGVPVVWPLLYLFLRSVLSDALWSACRLPVMLFTVLGGLFVPIYIVGKKYEKINEIPPQKVY